VKHLSTYELHELSQSKVFKNGKPLVVYHGTNHKFERFDASYMGQTDEGFYGRGFYFTLDKEEASEYGPVIISAYLDVRNPFHLRSWSTLGSYIELDLRDDLAELDGVPAYFKTDRKIPVGYLLKRTEETKGNDKVVTFAVWPKEELYGTEREIYGPDVSVTVDEIKRPGREKGYSDKAIVEFNDIQKGVNFDEGLANWVLQKIDRYNFHELLKKNGYDGTFVVGEKGPNTPIEEVSEIVVWDPDQIRILQ